MIIIQASKVKEECFICWMLEYGTLEQKYTTNASNGNFIFNLVNMLRQRDKTVKTVDRKTRRENIEIQNTK